MVRLLTYLPGKPVAKIATNAQIFYEIGKLAASLDKALSEVSFHCSGLTNFFLNFSSVFLLVLAVCFPDLQNSGW